MLGWAEENTIPVFIVGDPMRFFPNFNQEIDKNSLFEHVDYARHMKILCETDLIDPKKLSQLEGNFNRGGKAKDQ